MPWSRETARAMLRHAQPSDDKYSRGVLGVVTGSSDYPGAAVLGVEAAMRTGVGLVRYLGQASSLVLQSRPEAVCVPGPVDAWLIGSGMSRLSPTDPILARIAASAHPVIADAGALEPLVLERLGTGRTLFLTPHAGEAARLLDWNRDEVLANPRAAARELASRWSATVLVKGNRTVIADARGHELECGPATPRLASAGTGDVLAGILAALVLGRPDAAAIDLAAAAVWIHSAAAERIVGPILALELAREVAAVVAEVGS